MSCERRDRQGSFAAMHRSLLALAALAFIASCNEEDPAALFAEVDYQLRCLGCTPVSPDAPKRELSVVNGEGGNQLECFATGDRITLRISGEGYGFDIVDALVGDDPGNQCQIRVIEGANEYRGYCKAIGDSGSNPCEVELTRSGSGFDGTVECHNIQHKNNASWTRQLLAPGTMDKPATISAQGCSGL